MSVVTIGYQPVLSAFSYCRNIQLFVRTSDIRARLRRSLAFTFSAQKSNFLRIFLTSAILFIGNLRLTTRL